MDKRRQLKLPADLLGRRKGSAAKDVTLNALAGCVNVAQFVSFGPDMGQRYSRVFGRPSNFRWSSPKEAVQNLLECSPERSVSIRTFVPGRSEGFQFIYDVRELSVVMDEVLRAGSMGLYTIVNETIDVNAGGVAGVVFGGVIEFAPKDSPRCVEQPGVLALPRDVGLSLLEKVYGVRPRLDFEDCFRVEFTFHPYKRGVRREHTIVWELERLEPVELRANLRWPNRFSRFVGDKAFGLLIADVLGLPVPTTVVISRAVAPFKFGASTGTAEAWTRTCPSEPIPGRFATKFGWFDPFKLLAEEDPEGKVIASVLCQEGVEPCYSGAAIAGRDGIPIIEGVRGRGDEFMQGRRGPEVLPDRVVKSAKRLYELAESQIGPIRMEWVHDKRKAWLVQLHKGQTATTEETIFPGEASFYCRFDVTKGIEALREIVGKIGLRGAGIILVGNIGVTSHLADLLRQARIPSRIERVQGSDSAVL